MNQKLFIRLYLDEDVTVLLAELIQARGFEAITTRDAGNLHQSDEAQLTFATQQRMVVVTHNRLDFEQLAQAYFMQGRRHAGIIIAVRRSPYDMVRRLVKILNHVTADEMYNQVRYI